jgi:hypothetical protein
MNEARLIAAKKSEIQSDACIASRKMDAISSKTSLLSPSKPPAPDRTKVL